ncbi:Hpt domain-containing protein [Celeribacter sp. ULVN23_4]
MKDNSVSILDIQQKLAQTMQHTRQRFVADLCVKIDEIEKLQTQIEESPNDAKALARLSFITHRFSGLAATVGFSELGDCAAQIELAVADFEVSKPQTQPMTDRIEMLLDLMEDAIVEAS